MDFKNSKKLYRLAQGEKRGIYMEIKVIQTGREYGKADFQVYDENQAPIGRLDFSWEKGGFKCKAVASVGDKNLYFNQLSNIEAAKNNPYKEISKHPNDTYEISGDLGNGRVFTNSEKTSFLTRRFVPTMCLNNSVYVSYTAGFGEKGYKTAIYKDDIRIANVFTDCKVIDDMHHFRIEMIDDSCVLELVAMMAHRIRFGALRGDNYTKGVNVNVLVTTDKYILDKVL